MSQKYRLVFLELPDAPHLQTQLVRALVEESLEYSRLHFKQPEEVMLDVHEVVIVIIQL